MRLHQIDRVFLAVTVDGTASGLSHLIPTELDVPLSLLCCSNRSSHFGMFHLIGIS